MKLALPTLSEVSSKLEGLLKTETNVLQAFRTFLEKTFLPDSGVSPEKPEVWRHSEQEIQRHKALWFLMFSHRLLYGASGMYSPHKITSGSLAPISTPPRPPVHLQVLLPHTVHTLKASHLPCGVHTKPLCVPFSPNCSYFSAGQTRNQSNIHAIHVIF